MSESRPLKTINKSFMLEMHKNNDLDDISNNLIQSQDHKILKIKNKDTTIDPKISQVYDSSII